MSSAELLGRKDELTAVNRLTDPARGGPGVLLLEGSAGIGKTAIWSIGLKLARERGLRVITCRPSPTEMPLAFSALGDLLREMTGKFLPLLPAPQRNALEISLVLREPEGAVPDQRAVSLATLNLLRTASEDTPLLIGIDDVQWLDSSSARVLAFVLRRIEQERCRVLLTRRIENGGGRKAEFDSELVLGAVAGLERYTVGPLSLGAIRTLIRTRLSARLPRKLVVSICEASGGNPFFALELARAQLEREQIEPGEPLRMPESLSGLVKERLAGLPDETRDALLIAATLFQPTLEMLGKTDAAGLEEAVSVGILEIDQGRVLFTHPLRASVVYAEASFADRRAAHVRAAELTRNPEERVRHRALSTAPPNEEIASELEQAAGAAAARAAPAAAAELCELAIELTPVADFEALARRRLAAAEHHFETGEIERCRALLESISSELGPCPERADALILLSETTGDLDDSLRLCRQAVEEANGDDARLARSSIMLGASYARVNRNADQLEAAQTALEHAERAGDKRLLIESLQGVANARVLLGENPDEELMQRALDLEQEIGGLPGRRSPRVWKAMHLSWTDELEEARVLVQSETERALNEGQLTEWLHLVSMRIFLEILTGNYPLAERLAEEALREAEDVGIPYITLNLEGMYYASRSLLGEPGAREGLIGVLEGARRHSHVQAAFIAVSYLTLLELLDGDAAEAWSWISKLAEFGMAIFGVTIGPEGQVAGLPTRQLSHLVLAVEALAGMGDLGRAEKIYEQLRLTAERAKRPSVVAGAERSLGIIQAARGDINTAAEIFGRAFESYSRVPIPFDLARTELIYGILLRRAKRRGESREILSRARERFQRLHATQWAARAQSELDRTGARRGSADDGLTPTERQVAELVASGQSNKEVAASLFMSVRTVEANLSKIYRKLGIKSRAELPGRLNKR